MVFEVCAVPLHHRCLNIQLRTSLYKEGFLSFSSRWKNWRFLRPHVHFWCLFQQVFWSSDVTLQCFHLGAVLHLYSKPFSMSSTSTFINQQRILEGSACDFLRNNIAEYWINHYINAVVSRFKRAVNNVKLISNRFFKCKKILNLGLILSVGNTGLIFISIQYFICFVFFSFA